MFKVIRFFTLILIAILFFGCESKPTRPLSVSTNLWIGYSPLYYAQKKGWLRENNIKLIRTVSIGESLATYKKNSSDVFCGTQYEIDKMYKSAHLKANIILLDRSNGGDYVFGNRSINELKLEKNIDVYMEVESVNSILLKYFMSKYNLKKSQLNIIDSSIVFNSNLKLKKNATLIITYNPYNIALQKKGYRELASTKDKDLLVLDAIYINQNILKKYNQEITNLNVLISKALSALKKNPKE